MRLRSAVCIGILPAMEPVLITAASVEQRKQALDAERLMRTCAHCGAEMEQRKCKLICHGCGYFLSCSDYY
jgi:Zn finger protein HypA/HybF involved in hydrogenase expression